LGYPREELLTINNLRRWSAGCSSQHLTGVAEKEKKL